MIVMESLNGWWWNRCRANTKKASKKRHKRCQTHLREWRYFSVIWPDTRSRLVSECVELNYNSHIRSGLALASVAFPFHLKAKRVVVLRPLPELASVKSWHFRQADCVWLCNLLSPAAGASWSRSWRAGDSRLRARRRSTRQRRRGPGPAPLRSRPSGRRFTPSR